MALNSDALAALGRAAGVAPALTLIYPVLIDALLIVSICGSGLHALARGAPLRRLARWLRRRVAAMSLASAWSS